MRGNQFSISYFKCTLCGGMIPLPRSKSQKRSKNHVKDLYCPFCKNETKTVEYRNRDFYMTLADVTVD